ncbi:MAG: LLM class flavin-dependent oxidoreductase [Pelagimonas sp.]|jgi:alkanesulfonate monooxygenase SsuD/methylene tetrahydromethanopterin reductase-like flavin-dependent oxidoreductase (luciferase family)|nr:LLM class flavin-dependent oxidoreductase [Pelagimonas sp.]
MEFSLFNLMTKPVDGSTHADVFTQMRNMTRMVDDAGFDVAWFAEHHLSNYCISPSPLMTASHMAGMTKRIKLGPAVVVMPFYEPLRLVEDICLTDQLTDGRLVLGLGTGYQPREFKKFGFAIDDRLMRGLEIWDCIEQGVYNGVIDYEGDHIQIRDAALSIAPVQDRIRTFAVGNAPEMRQKMMDYGAEPLTTPAIGPNTIVGTARRLYKETRAENGLSGDDFPFAVQRYVYIAKDKEDARAAAEQVLIHVRMANNMRRPEPLMQGADLNIVPFDGEPDLDLVMHRAIIGDVEEVTRRIVAEAREFGITHLSVFMQIASIPFANTLRSLELFCDQVMPAVNAALEEDKKAIAS